MRLSLQAIGKNLATTDTLYIENKKHIEGLESELSHKRDVVRAGWGEKYVERVHQKAKLTTLERIALLIDSNSEIFPVCSLVNWGRDFEANAQQKRIRSTLHQLRTALEDENITKDVLEEILSNATKHHPKFAPGAGVVTAFCQIRSRWVMVIANDNTVASGSWWPRTPEKIQRAQDMALRLRIPVVYLVDCSGLFLPEQSLSFPGKHGAGHIFQRNAVLSAEGVPQIAGVFGDCIAGGGYMPIISDRVFMTESAYMVIAGAALIKGAKSQQLTSLDIGGPEVHVHQSGCADDRVPDDSTCIQFIQREIEKLPSSAIEYYRFGADVQEPISSPAELYGIFPKDHRHSYSITEVLARLVDGSVVHEYLPHTGKEICTVIARISGLWVGLACNVQEPQKHPERDELRPGGILYKEGIAKLASFSRACNDDGIPLFWFQDIAGFDIGLEAESLGLLGYGSSLIYSNSTNKAPFFSILLRKASGAGYYAMAGLPYEPIVQLSTTFSRLSVMEGRTLAIAAYRTKLDDNFEIDTTDPDERKKIAQGMESTAQRIEEDMDPVKAAAQMDTDEIICLHELRDWLCLLAECSYQSIGYRRVKNPRIWSIHDQNVLCQMRRDVKETVSKEQEKIVVAKEGSTPICAQMPGTFWTRPSPDSSPFIQEGDYVQEGQTLALVEVMKTFTSVTSTISGKFLGWEMTDGASISSSNVLGWITTLDEF